MFLALLQREFLIHLRNISQIIWSLVFFILTLCLFPLALGADKKLLLEVAPAALWITLILAILPASENLLKEDYNDGSLSQDYIHIDLYLVLIAKIFVSWLKFIIPIILVLPLATLFLNLSLIQLPIISLQIIIGSLGLFLLGSLASTLILSGTENRFLLFLIVMPFFIPLLIFGVSATKDLILELPYLAKMAILLALSLFYILIILPFSVLAIKSQNLP